VREGWPDQAVRLKSLKVNELELTVDQEQVACMKIAVSVSGGVDTKGDIKRLMRKLAPTTSI
jgi:predicted PP-loop superfamily ATPase